MEMREDRNESGNRDWFEIATDKAPMIEMTCEGKLPRVRLDRKVSSSPRIRQMSPPILVSQGIPLPRPTGGLLQ